MKNKPNITATIDGSKYANYINERLNSPGFTVDDMDKLRDDPTVLQHIKALYQVIMHNRACFVDESLRRLGFEDLRFPRGRVKLFKDKDYTFSFTELSEYGLNAKSFSELYASIGVFNGLSVQDAAKKMCIIGYDDLSIGSFLFPEVSIDVVFLYTERDYDKEYQADDPWDDMIFETDKSTLYFNLTAMQGGYDISDLIKGTYTDFKKLSTQMHFENLTLNYSSICYDDSWFSECLAVDKNFLPNEEYSIFTEEAVEALTFIAIEKNLSPRDGFLYSYRTYGIEKFKVEYAIGDFLPISIKLLVPGTLLLTDTDFAERFDRVTSLDLLPEVSVGYKHLLKSFFIIGQGTVTSKFFFEPIISSDKCLMPTLDTDWQRDPVPIREK